MAILWYTVYLLTAKNSQSQRLIFFSEFTVHIITVEYEIAFIVSLKKTRLSPFFYVASVVTLNLKMFTPPFANAYLHVDEINLSVKLHKYKLSICCKFVILFQGFNLITFIFFFTNNVILLIDFLFINLVKINAS